jgi:CheY-like chemotaxis protein
MAKKILIVDDSLTSRTINRILITKRAGYEVVSAQNGKEALKLVGLENPDLILMDVMMPGMDGLEVCRHLRKQEKTAAIPIVLLTFQIGDESVRDGFESGCTAYLKKPVEEAELLSTLHRYLGTQN